MNTTTPSVHAYNSKGNNGAFPGVAMSLVSGANYLYSSTVSSYTTGLIFSNGYDGYGNKTGDLSYDSKEVCIINDDWSVEWSSLEAATFVDKYMKFNSYGPSEKDELTEDCASNYSAARLAFNNLSSDSVRSEVLGIKEKKKILLF